MKKAGSPQDIAVLLKYEASEQNRRYEPLWEQIQILLGLMLVACLFLGTQRRIYPMAFCGLMIVMVIFELRALSPELAFRGRQADFPPASSVFENARRVYALGQVYGWVEGTKLTLGFLLSGYLFIFRPRRTRKQVDLIDSPSHIAD